MDAEQVIKQILSLQLDVPVEKIEPSNRIVDDLGADSLCIIEITLSVEESFGMDISDEDVHGLGVEATVKNLIDYVEKRQARQRNDEPTVRMGGVTTGRFSSDEPNYSTVPRSDREKH